MTEDQTEKPLENFVNHQRNAATEAARAMISLVPEGLRKHGWNAIEESAKGFGNLAEAAAEEVSNMSNRATKAYQDVKNEVVPNSDDKKS